MRKFSWKRATGFSNAKRKFNKATGITAVRKAKFAMEHPVDAALNAGAKSTRRSLRRTKGKGCGCPCSVMLLAMLALPLIAALVFLK